MVVPRDLVSLQSATFKIPFWEIACLGDEDFKFLGHVRIGIWPRDLKDGIVFATTSV
jgi:hypothetical protein